MSNLVAMLEARAEEHPERMALSAMCGRRVEEVGYADLLKRVSGGAAFLRRLGLCSGEAVLFVHPVSIPLYESMLACMYAGMVPVIVDLSAGREILNQACERMRPRAVVYGGPAWMLRLVSPVMRSIPLAVHSYGWSLFGKRWRTDVGEGVMEAVAGEHPALVTFTSGSTGKAKVVVRSHGFLLAQHEELSKALGHEEGQIDLVTLPVFALANLASGMTSVLADMDFRKPGCPDARRIAHQIEKTGVGRCAASPAFFQALVGAMPEVLGRLQRIDMGGAPVFPDLLERLRKVCEERCRIEVVYGSSEAEPISHLAFEEMDSAVLDKIRNGAGLPVGRRVEGIEFEVIEDCWGKPLVELDEAEFLSLKREAGSPGEIVVRGEHVVRGYLDGVGDAENKIRVGSSVWHRTGDAGYVDAEGRIWLVGRCSAADRREGLEGVLYPLAVEAAVRVMSGRASAFIVNEGVRCVCIQGSIGEVERGDLLGGLRWANIERIIEIEDLPLDSRHNAKIDYPKLRRMLGVE